jgi:hypothetical protein
MGILDDAIREHLELKRSHGASETEIKQKEAEVFGAARSEAAPVAPPEALQDEHTQLLTPEAHDAAPAEIEPLQPAPEDPYAVHPGDDLVPDPEVPEVAQEHHEPLVDAGAESFEPTQVDPGPPMPPPHHHEEQHPALVDHDHIGGEEYACSRRRRSSYRTRPSTIASGSSRSPRATSTSASDAKGAAPLPLTPPPKLTEPSMPSHV